MREIKFRAWHSLDNEMVYFNNEKLVNDQYQMQHLACLMRGDYGDVLMQYTGLKDVNGKEIYEGDIIKVVSSISSEIFLVEMHMGNASYSSKPECPLGSIFPTMVTMTKEVIGNIYENPELLEDN